MFRKIVKFCKLRRKANLVQILDKVELLKPLAKYDLTAFQEIADAMDSDEYAADTTIICEGQPGNMFYIIESGSVAVQRQQSDGSDERVCVLK